MNFILLYLCRECGRNISYRNHSESEIVYRKGYAKCQCSSGTVRVKEVESFKVEQMAIYCAENNYVYEIKSE